jgi:hypothetical protein
MVVLAVLAVAAAVRSKASVRHASAGENGATAEGWSANKATSFILLSMPPLLGYESIRASWLSVVGQWIWRPMSLDKRADVMYVTCCVSVSSSTVRSTILVHSTTAEGMAKAKKRV